VSTYAILFLGTPHHGTDKASLVSTARRMIAAVTPSKILDSDAQLLDALKEGSETLENITDGFVPLMSKFRVFFFWESEKMDLKGTLDYVVTQESAAPNIPDTRRAGLRTDHVGLARFESASTPGFRVVAAAVKQYATEAPIVIARSHKRYRELAIMRRENEAAELLDML
jgi:hypothetical protein